MRALVFAGVAKEAHLAVTLALGTTFAMSRADVAFGILATRHQAVFSSKPFSTGTCGSCCGFSVQSTLPMPCTDSTFDEPWALVLTHEPEEPRLTSTGRFAVHYHTSPILRAYIPCCIARALEVASWASPAFPTCADSLAELVKLTLAKAAADMSRGHGAFLVALVTKETKLALALCSNFLFVERASAMTITHLVQVWVFHSWACKLAFLSFS
jgi:hypothetical protein